MDSTASPGVSGAMLSAAERERIYRRNFVLFLSDFVLFAVGLSLIGSTTVIPDFVRKLTDSEILIAMSSQVFEIGWLLPQLLVARWLVGVERKKWWFVGPNIPVRVLILVFSGTIILLGSDHLSVILVLFFVFYALAGLGDGLVGVPWMDMMGSSLDDRRRTRMFGLGYALTGIIMLVLAPAVRLILGHERLEFPNNYAVLFAASGFLFLITIPIIMLVRELPGGKPQATTPPLRDYLPGLAHVIRQDAPYRAIIAARVLATFAMMAAPFYIGFATVRLKVASDVAVSNLLLMQTLGSVTGSLLYSWRGDRRSLGFIRLALAAGLTQPLLALLATGLGPVALYGAFLAGGLAGGASLSFLNWVISYATPEERPVYAGLFNSMSAIGILVSPLLGGVLVELIDYEAVFVGALLMMGAALGVALRYGKPEYARAP